MTPGAPAVERQHVLQGDVAGRKRRSVPRAPRITSNTPAWVKQVPADVMAEWLVLPVVEQAWQMQEWSEAHDGSSAPGVLGIPEKIHMGTLFLRQKHPALAAEVRGLPNAEAQRIFGSARMWYYRSRRHSERHFDALIPRLTPKQFISMFFAFSRYSRLVPVLLALPDEMLKVAAGMTKHQVSSAFVQVGHRSDQVRHPRPSVFFPGIHPTMDEKVIRLGKATDVPLLRELATVPPLEQHAYLRRRLADPEQAQRWAAAPTWQRELLPGDDEAEKIWKALHTLLRSLTMPGVQLQWIAGDLFNGDPSRRRWHSVFSSLGHALEVGKVTLGDLHEKQPPWQ